MSIRIEEVKSYFQRKAFYEVPHIIYKDDPNWVSPLDEEIQAIFNPKKNSFFRHGIATRWIFRDANGNLIGRVAAFINKKKAGNYEVPTGGIGFYESIDDQDVANTIFDTAKSWLKERGMEAMDGPINFGENDRYWGLLVHGFTQPAFGMPYHPPYYQKLWENYGFKMFFEQVSNELNLLNPMPERFFRIAKRVFSKSNVDFRHPTPDNFHDFAKAFQEVYNDAWQFHENFTPITDEQMRKFEKEFSRIAISLFLPFVYVDGEAAGFIICIPDLNQIFKPLKGKFNIFQKLLFLWRKRNEFEWYRKQDILNHARVVIMGIKPKFQKMGLDAGLILSSIEDVKKMGFKSIELSWVGDFNPKMRRLHDAVGAKMIRKHYTYRHFFDPNHDGNRSEIIPMNTKENRTEKNSDEGA